MAGLGRLTVRCNFVLYSMVDCPGITGEATWQRWIASLSRASNSMRSATLRESIGSVPPMHVPFCSALALAERMPMLLRSPSAIRKAPEAWLKTGGEAVVTDAILQPTNPEFLPTTKAAAMDDPVCLASPKAEGRDP